MHDRLYDYYERELAHLKESSRDFAEAYPKVAGRLGMHELEVHDPYVDGLMQSFAYLTARVQLRIDDEFPRFTHQLLETLYPHYLKPCPSMGIVRFVPDMAAGSLGEGPEVPAGTTLKAGVVGRVRGTTPVRYRTAHPVRLWPVEITEAAYHARDVASLGLGGAADGARAAIRLRLRFTGPVPPAELPLEDLDLHLPPDREAGWRIYETLVGHGAGVVVHDVARPSKHVVPLGADAIRQLGFDDDEALLPFSRRSFQGYRLLHEYMTFPQRFLFVRLAGIGEGVRRIGAREIDVTILLDEDDPDLERSLDADCFALHCTPVVNLFEKRLGRLRVDARRSEYVLRSASDDPRDYEVYDVTSVIGFGAGGRDSMREFLPFYRARGTDAGTESAYYATHRVPRRMTDREQMRRGGAHFRSKYPGSDVFLSIVDGSMAPFHPDLRELEVVTVCTNRDLPTGIEARAEDATLTHELGVPIADIRFTGRPSAPRPSVTHGDYCWRLVSHLTPSYLSLEDADEGQAAATLREIMGLYGGQDEHGRPERAIQRRLEGIVEVSTKPVVRRVGRRGPIAFARGLEITLKLDEQRFEGDSAFVCSAVLERFLARHVALNSFTTLRAETIQRGELMRWPIRAGRRSVL